MHIVYKRGAAAACKYTFFYKLLSFACGYHVSAKGSLYHCMEAKRLYAANNLPKFRVLKLACYCRRNYSIYPILGVVLAALNYIYRIKQEGLAHYSSKWALVHASAAGYTFVIINIRSHIFIHAYGFYNTTGVFAGTGMVSYGAIGAYLCA